MGVGQGESESICTHSIHNKTCPLPNDARNAHNTPGMSSKFCFNVYSPVAGPTNLNTIQPPMTTNTIAYACEAVRQQRSDGAMRCVEQGAHNLVCPPQDALLAGPEQPRRLHR
jgi:hypothetical protein